MYSSKVIKPDELKDSKVCNVNYELLVGSFPTGDEANAFIESEGFTPLFFNDVLGVRDDKDHLFGEREGLDAAGESSVAERVLSEPPEGMQLIEDQELQRMLSESYGRGIEEGRLAAEKGLANVFKALREGTVALAELRDKILRESEGDLLKLATMIARKIIMQELKQDSRILANIVEATVSCCSENEKITIRLSQEDYRMVTGEQQLFTGIKLDQSRITLAPDDSIKLGGCMVETPTGTVDSRIETQLDEVFNRCLEERGVPREPSIRLNDEG